MNKILKWILIVILVFSLFIGASMIFVIYIFIDSTSDADVYGDIIILKEENIKVGDLVPIVFKVPDEFSDLHKEMWDCEIEINGELNTRFEYILERTAFQELYTKDEIDKFFSNSPINIYEEDDDEYKIENSDYTSKVALFMPEEAGVYYISVFGYYRSTSPSGYGSIKVVVYD